MSEQIVDSEVLASTEKELRALCAFLEGFSETLTGTPTGQAEAKRVGIDLRRFG